MTIEQASAATGGHHQRPVHEVVLVLQTHLDIGLSEQDAAERLARFGPNTLPPNRTHGPVVRFLLQFNNPLIYVLIVAAVVGATDGTGMSA